MQNNPEQESGGKNMPRKEFIQTLGLYLASYLVGLQSVFGSNSGSKSREVPTHERYLFDNPPKLLKNYMEQFRNWQEVVAEQKRSVIELIKSENYKIALRAQYSRYYSAALKMERITREQFDQYTDDSMLNQFVDQVVLARLGWVDAARISYPELEAEKTIGRIGKDGGVEVDTSRTVDLNSNEPVAQNEGYTTAFHEYYHTTHPRPFLQMIADVYARFLFESTNEKTSPEFYELCNPTSLAALSAYVDKSVESVPDDLLQSGTVAPVNASEIRHLSKDIPYAMRPHEFVTYIMEIRYTLYIVSKHNPKLGLNYDWLHPVTPEHIQFLKRNYKDIFPYRKTVYDETEIIAPGYHVIILNLFPDDTLAEICNTIV
jgi:hypothetical protein